MIRPSKTKTHGIKGDPTTPRPPKPPSQRINKQKLNKNMKSIINKLVENILNY